MMNKEELNELLGILEIKDDITNVKKEDVNANATSES